MSKWLGADCHRKGGVGHLSHNSTPSVEASKIWRLQMKRYMSMRSCVADGGLGFVDCLCASSHIYGMEWAHYWRRSEDANGWEMGELVCEGDVLNL